MAHPDKTKSIHAAFTWRPGLCSKPTRIQESPAMRVASFSASSTRAGGVHFAVLGDEINQPAQAKFMAKTTDKPGPVAVLSKVERTYKLDMVSVPVIKGIDLLIRPAHFTVILGPSGSGKTTLLNMLGC